MEATEHLNYRANNLRLVLPLPDDHSPHAAVTVPRKGGYDHAVVQLAKREVNAFCPSIDILIMF